MSRQRPATPNDIGALPSRRPATPAEALSGQSSSAWVPDPEPGPSPDFQPASRRPATPNDALGIPSEQRPLPASTPTDSSPLHNPWVWITLAGVAVVLIGFLVFVISRPTKPTEQSTTDTPTTPAPAPSLADTTHSPTQQPKLQLPVSTSPRKVDLLKLVDPSRDTIDGTWMFVNGQLKSNDALRARINIPYDPPREYDFVIEFTRNAGIDCVVQDFTNVRQCAWMMGGWKGTINGFHLVNDKTAQYNPGSDKSFILENGQRHTSLVRVRRNYIEGVVDGKVLVHHETDGNNLLSKEWSVTAPLGLGTCQSPTTFHRAELIEVSQ